MAFRGKAKLRAGLAESTDSIEVPGLQSEPDPLLLPPPEGTGRGGIPGNARGGGRRQWRGGGSRDGARGFEETAREVFVRAASAVAGRCEGSVIGGEVDGAE